MVNLGLQSIYRVYSRYLGFTVDILGLRSISRVYDRYLGITVFNVQNDFHRYQTVGKVPKVMCIEFVKIDLFDAWTNWSIALRTFDDKICWHVTTSKVVLCLTHVFTFICHLQISQYQYYGFSWWDHLCVNKQSMNFVSYRVLIIIAELLSNILIMEQGNETFYEKVLFSWCG